MTPFLTTEQFIQKASLLHNNKYDYSKSIYVNSRSKLIIICPIHGEFLQKPNNHLAPFGCNKCGIQKTANLQRSDKDTFIQKANQIHNNKYNYLLAKYIDCKTNLKIICPAHGEFEQTPNKHLQGHGCQKCTLSKGEMKIEDYLNKNNIIFVPEYKFDNCKNIHKLRFDFYLPKYNLCIEYDGIQHYMARSFGSNQSNESKNFNLSEIKKRDDIKTQYCIDNDINLLRIRYNQFPNINNIIESHLKHLTTSLHRNPESPQNCIPLRIYT